MVSDITLGDAIFPCMELSKDVVRRFLRGLDQQLIKTGMPLLSRLTSLPAPSLALVVNSLPQSYVRHKCLLFSFDGAPQY